MHHLFVYGTLRPGEVRWHHLEPFVVGDGTDTTVGGELYDTGLEYPAAIFRQSGANACDAAGSALIRGRTYELALDRLARALEHLDAVEGAVRGLYRRVVVHTAEGRAAWAYECGDERLLARRLETGDWLDR
ncbi:MAG: gamma-glutamylcyclotransferase family protein [Ilumatobacteraceae bacterium]